MKSISKMTQAELAATVQVHLQKKGITVILSGGAAVAIYTDNKYVSADIDLVDVYFADRKKIKAAMEDDLERILKACVYSRKSQIICY